MSYKEKPLLKIYKYENSAFILKAIIDDYATCSFQRSKYSAGQFSIQINFNIPNSQIFEKGLFIQFGNDEKDFGVITDVKDVIGESGKGSQTRTITGYDGRYILQRRIIKNLNNNENWTYTGKGENCIRKLINSQCGTEVEEERQLPIINNIPEEENAFGNQYTVAEAYSNLLSVCETIATQSEVGWGIKFNGNLELYFYSGEDLSENVKFTTDYDSLRSGNFSDSLKSYCNAIYIGGKGNGSERDIYLGTDGNPSGLDRFEGWDNQSSLTEETEYEAEANSMLSQYGQTISLTGQGLAKCPYEYKKQYDVGDIITVGFSGKSAKVQILSVTENWQWGSYNIDFEFGKPIIDLSTQLKMILKQIQVASSSTESKYTDSIKYYTIPTDTEMADGDVAFSTIGFKGNFGSGATFKLKYNTSGTGSKNYHIYINQTTGSGKLTLTTGVAGASNLTLSSGTYVQLVYVDSNGNIKNGLALDDTTTSGSTSWSSEKTQSQILAGGQYTGKIIMPRNQYGINAPLDMSNSDINGANALRFNDVAENGTEGILFPRSETGREESFFIDGSGTPYIQNIDGGVAGAKWRMCTSSPETVTLTYSISGSVTLSGMAAKRYGNFLNVKFNLTPTANIAAGSTVVVNLNSTQVTLPSTAMDGTATGASFYGATVFTYQYNTDNAKAVKIRNHSQWSTGQNVTFVLNIPLISF